jgi:hypothetical protein
MYEVTGCIMNILLGIRPPFYVNSASYLNICLSRILFQMGGYRGKA